MSNAVDKILCNYSTLTDAQKKNLEAILNFGLTGGSGKCVILPVDQGFEHGPDRSFSPNPAAYDPLYHACLAVRGGCNAYAAPLGAIEAAYDFIRSSSLPIILKVNNHDLMMPDSQDPLPAVTSWAEDAQRLKAQAVGFTIYPGSAHSREMYQQLKELVKDAKLYGLVVVVWAYPRGSGLPNKEAETATDVIAYAVHIACQLGAHIIKCKPPTSLYGLPDSQKRDIYKNVPHETLAERAAIITQAAFKRKRIVIFSGGEFKDEEALLNEIKELKKGGGFGSIIGRNAFQRPLPEAIALLHKIQNVWLSD